MSSIKSARSLGEERVASVEDLVDIEPDDKKHANEEIPQQKGKRRPQLPSGHTDDDRTKSMFADWASRSRTNEMTVLGLAPRRRDFRKYARSIDQGFGAQVAQDRVTPQPDIRITAPSHGLDDSDTSMARLKGSHGKETSSKFLDEQAKDVDHLETEPQPMRQADQAITGSVRDDNTPDGSKSVTLARSVQGGSLRATRSLEAIAHSLASFQTVNDRYGDATGGSIHRRSASIGLLSDERRSTRPYTSNTRPMSGPNLKDQSRWDRPPHNRRLSTSTLSSRYGTISNSSTKYGSNPSTKYSSTTSSSSMYGFNSSSLNPASSSSYIYQSSLLRGRPRFPSSPSYLRSSLSYSQPSYASTSAETLIERSQDDTSGASLLLPIYSERHKDIVVLDTDMIIAGSGARHSYIQIIAWLILENIRVDTQSDLLFVGSSTIADLLAQFATRLEDDSPNSLFTGIAVSVYKYRTDIAILCNQIHTQQHDNPILGPSGTSHGLHPPVTRYQAGSSIYNAIQKMQAWMDHITKVDAKHSTNLDAVETSLLHALRLLLAKNLNYKWLISRLQRTILYTTAKAQADIAEAIGARFRLDHTIRDKMSAAFSRMLNPSEHSDTPKTSTISKISLHLNWNIEAFLREQFMRMGISDHQNPLNVSNLEDIITVTGSLTECQLLTCKNYLELVWPQLGMKVLRGLQMFFFDNRGEPIKLDDSINMAIKWSHNMDLKGPRSLTEVNLEGALFDIIDVTEILAWLSTALRVTESGIMGCWPEIYELFGLSKHQSVPVFEIRLFNQEVQPNTNGNCWHGMFRSSTVVLGYPIQCRPGIKGLEISLASISELLCSKRVNIFNGKLLLKSFSAMLLPIARDKDIVQWHYVYDKKGRYLDFSAAESFDYGAGVNEHDLQLRHIVGWCSEAKTIAGAPGQHYSIQRSRLPKTKSGIVLKSFSLSAGTQPGASLGASIAVGVKDRPLHVYPAGYGIIEKLRWISEKHVVLYDAQEQRGWLVNGLCALLHLLRTSLHSYSIDKFSSALKLKPEHITEPPGDYPDAAIDFFLENDYKNLKLELFIKNFESFTESIGSERGVSKLRTTSVLLKDRVEDLWEILAHAITQQVDVARQDGIYYRPRFRKTLDGWDFMNIATGLSQFEPVSATLDCFQQPWVDLIRALNIPVLFGQNFGEIIQPAKMEQNACPYWQTLPTGKNYLAATTATMKEIMDEHGDPTLRPMKVCENILWFASSTSRSICKCVAREEGKHIDNVQVLWPDGLKSRSMHNISTPTLSSKGAVVFGHNSSFSWVRNELGVAVEGLLNVGKSKEQPRNVVDGPTNDVSSGSLSNTSEEESISSQSAPSQQSIPTTPSNDNGSSPTAQTGISMKLSNLKNKADFLRKSKKKDTASEHE